MGKLDLIWMGGPPLESRGLVESGAATLGPTARRVAEFRGTMTPDNGVALTSGWLDGTGKRQKADIFAEVY